MSDWAIMAQKLGENILNRNHYGNFISCDDVS